VRDVRAFVSKASAVLPSAASAKKILAQVAEVGGKFAAIALRYAPIAGEQGGGGAQRSHATEFAMLMRNFIRRHPVIQDKEAFSDAGGYAALLSFHSLFLLPELIVYPQATYDILAGMLDGLMATFGAIEKDDARAAVLANWKYMSKVLDYEARELEPRVELVAAPTPAAPAPTTKAAASIASSAMTPKPLLSAGSAKKAEEFVRRFAYDSDEE
jgi:hypothetical protein